MLLHLTRAQSGWWRRRYRLTARLDTSPAELEAIRAHRIDRLELFHDPLRDQLLARADAADQRASALGFWIDTGAKAGRLALETTRGLVLRVRAVMAFKLVVGDLLGPGGIAVEHRDLAVIIELEQALTVSIDALDARIGAALAFEHNSEDILAPGEDDDRTPPSGWPRRARPW